MNFEGAKALITGGSEGIGYAIAEAFKAEGAAVAITGRRADVLEAAAQELAVESIQGDVGLEADAVRTVREFTERHGRIDILVNNAGVGHFTPLTDMQLKDFEQLFRTNVTGAMLMAREAARHFIRQKSGELINISSTSGLKGGASRRNNSLGAGHGCQCQQSHATTLQTLSCCNRLCLRDT